MLIIEKADKKDAQQVLDYLNIIGGESDNLLFGLNEFILSLEEEEKHIESIKNSELNALFLGKIGEEIVCIGSLMTSPRKRIEHHADLAISVKKKYWGLGIGTQLMKTIIDYAKKNNRTEILHLGVKADNIAAINLYKKMGFEEIGVYKNFFKINNQYYDEILMNLYL